MTTLEKQAKIKLLVTEMLNDSHEAMLKKLDIVFNSGCIDAEFWDEKQSPMVLPKSIVTALLESESVQFSGLGTCYEKQVKKEVRNIRYFI